MTTDPARYQTFTISITPFAPDGTIDEAAFRRHLRKLSDAGIGVYVGGGGSGEGYSMSDEETERLLTIATDEIKGLSPVRAMGVEPRTARQMIGFLDRAKRAGVDAAQIYSLDVGHGHVPTPKELEYYFEEVLSNSDVPSVLSTHQSVGYFVPVPLIISLFERHRQLIGLNVSHQDPVYLKTLADAVGDRIDIMVGGPQQAPLALAIGAHGFLTSEGNLAPKLCVSVIEAAKTGDNAAFLNRWGKLMRLFLALYGNGGIRVTKAVLEHFGLAGGHLRQPRLSAEPDALANALAVVEEIGLAAIEGW